MKFQNCELFTFFLYQFTFYAKLANFNYFFLINNFNLKNYFFLCPFLLQNFNSKKTINSLNKKFKKLIIWNKIKIFKNLLYSLKFINFFKLFFFKNKTLFNFFYFKSLKSKKLSKKFVVTTFYAQFIKLYFNIAKCNWRLLTGKPMHSNTLLIETINEKNLMWVEEESKNFKNQITSIFIKKLFINNFYYFISTNSKFDEKLHLFNLKLHVKKNEFKNLLNLTKLYLFLNNSEFLKINTLSYDLKIYKIYKTYTKIFNLIKKTKYKKKLIKFYFFKNYYYNCQPVENKNMINYLENFINKKNENLDDIQIFINNYKLNKLNKFNKFKKIQKNQVNRFNLAKFSIIFKKTNFKNFFFKNKKIKKINLWLFLIKISNFQAPKLSKNKFYLFKNFLNKQNLIKFCFKKSFKFFIYTFTHFFINKNKPLTNFLDFNQNKLITDYTAFINYNKFENLILLTKEKNPFVLYRHGFLYLTEIFNNDSSFSQLISNLKRTLYSFSYKNELQRYILKRYFKMQLFDFYSEEDQSFFENNKNIFPINFNNFHSFSRIKILANNSFCAKNWPYFEKQLSFWQNYEKEILNFNIKRVRFKPGYMSLWREARQILKLSLNLKIKYQFRLTRYLMKYNKFIRFKTFLIFEMQLINLLVKSKIFPDHSLTLLFFSNIFVFVNNTFCMNPRFQMFIGDFVQLVISCKYYILHKWLITLTLKKKNKLKNISKKKLTIPENYEEKQKSNILPKWILFNKNITDDVIKHIEIDYFTLSFFILYEPFLWADTNFYNIKETRFSIINLYNWKYIT